MSVIEEQEVEVHQAYAERVNMLRWIAYCESCDYNEKVTKKEPGLTLEETAKKRVAEHQGKTYVQPGNSEPVDPWELEKGDLFRVNRALETMTLFKFVRIVESEWGDWVDCWELERHSKLGYVAVRARSFHLDEVASRAA